MRRSRVQNLKLNHLSIKRGYIGHAKWVKGHWPRVTFKYGGGLQFGPARSQSAQNLDQSISKTFVA